MPTNEGTFSGRPTSLVRHASGDYMIYEDVSTPSSTPSTPGEPDAPQGEPTPTDNAASTILSVPRDPVDIYALIAIRPQDVKALRPRWSLGRCRRWLREYESRLRAVMHEHMCDILSNYLENTSGRLLNRDRENARQPSLSMPDLATWTQLINRPTWDNSPIQSNPTPPQRPHYA